jgi:putative membrane protein
MFLDFTLASLHYLAVFTLAAILAFELALTAGAIDAAAIARLSRIDAWYGAMAALALAAGIARVFLGAKGPQYYAGNALFWTKMALFAAIASLSVLPTLRYIVWRRASRADKAYRPDVGAVRAVRRVLWSEVALFAGIPLCAAAIARGYGI